MKRWFGLPVAAVALTACVTINVYFPAAEAREAAKEFVENVIGDEAAQDTDDDNDNGGGDGGMAMLLPRPSTWLRTGVEIPAIDPLALVGIGSAHAQGQPDITIRTPAIQAIQSRMASRFDSTLSRHFDSGALGFTGDGLVTVRDAGKLQLKDRVAVNQAVADQNRDAKAVYREIAVANGHPEWEAQIRQVFAKQWVESAHKGWWYQSGGGWKQK
jgi:uncharacterized protein YdbL (DUF1318 family)